MHLDFNELECIGCGRCEIACGHVRDEAYSSTAASIMFYRAEDKKNYFGLLYKTTTELVSMRPEGLQVDRLGVPSQDAPPSSKPILLRPPCSLCSPAPCALACPTAAVQERPAAS